MKRSRRQLFSYLTDWAIRLKDHRPSAEELHAAARKQTSRSDLRRWPLRMTTFLRDRLRAGWLRIAGDDR